MVDLSKTEDVEQPPESFGVKRKVMHKLSIASLLVAETVSIAILILSAVNTINSNGETTVFNYIAILSACAAIGIPLGMYTEKSVLETNFHINATAASNLWYTQVLTPYLENKYGVRFLDVANNSGPHRVEKDGNIIEVNVFGINFKAIYNDYVVSEYTGNPIQPYLFPTITGEIELKMISGDPIYTNLATNPE